VTYKNAEEELRELLAALPSWVRKVLQHDFPLDSEEGAACNIAFEADGFRELVAWQEEYRTILRRIPKKWREYRQKLKRFALLNVPSGKPGRPRKDDEAEELKEKYQAGKSYKRIAIARLPVSRRSDDEEGKALRELAIDREAERIRKLIASRKPREPRSTPDKI
jgi:hypothetical protein